MYTDYDPIELYQRQQTRLIKRTLCNTYALLALTMVLGAFMAAIAAITGMPTLGLYLTLGGYLGLLLLAYKTQDNEWSLISLFLLCSFMGLTLGPMLSVYWSFAPAIVIKALFSMAIVFGFLSGLALIGKRQCSLLNSFLIIALLVACIAGLSAYIFELPNLTLKISAISALLLSALFVYAASRIVHEGQHDYVAATVSMFVAIFNLLGSWRYSFASKQAKGS